MYHANTLSLCGTGESNQGFALVRGSRLSASLSETPQVFLRGLSYIISFFAVPDFD